ncbi:Ldh family oxidoreductase, partial [Candidatus Poribacteria bacterium]|nr:Ldh family oxidoreductase [Candidatus Poribacteria bacterium]
MPVVDHTVLRDFGRSLYEAAGVPDDQAAIVTDHLVDSNLFGHDSHGMIHTPGYLGGIRAGTAKPVGDLKFVRNTPASAVIDADGGLGIVVARRAMEMAVDRAHEHTLGAVAVHSASHIGRLGAYPCDAAERDCVGVIMLNGGARCTAPFGGTAKRLPPNPIALAAPRHGGRPLMLDITTSMVALGKATMRRVRGEDMPEGWFIDGEGTPVTDPAKANDPDV